jgi:hypothetical protein
VGKATTQFGQGIEGSGDAECVWRSSLCGLVSTKNTATLIVSSPAPRTQTANSNHTTRHSPPVYLYLSHLSLPGLNSLLHGGTDAGRCSGYLTAGSRVEWVGCSDSAVVQRVSWSGTHREHVLFMEEHVFMGCLGSVSVTVWAMVCTRTIKTIKEILVEWVPNPAAALLSTTTTKSKTTKETAPGQCLCVGCADTANLRADPPA